VEIAFATDCSGAVVGVGEACGSPSRSITTPSGAPLQATVAVATASSAADANDVKRFMVVVLVVGECSQPGSALKRASCLGGEMTAELRCEGLVISFLA
jgi:hypothetical protein